MIDSQNHRARVCESPVRSLFAISARHAQASLSLFANPSPAEPWEMQEQRAHAILKALIDGNDPITGCELPPDSPLQHASVLRALLTAADALRNEGRRSARRAAMPSNVGKPWTETEFAQLIEGLRGGEPLEKIARRHGRTVRAIQARLHVMDPESYSGTTPRDAAKAASLLQRPMSRSEVEND